MKILVIVNNVITRVEESIEEVMNQITSLKMYTHLAGVDVALNSYKNYKSDDLKVSFLREGEFLVNIDSDIKLVKSYDEARNLIIESGYKELADSMLTVRTRTRLNITGGISGYYDLMVHSVSTVGKAYHRDGLLFDGDIPTGFDTDGYLSVIDDEQSEKTHYFNSSTSAKYYKERTYPNIALTKHQLTLINEIGFKQYMILVGHEINVLDMDMLTIGEVYAYRYGNIIKHVLDGDVIKTSIFISNYDLHKSMSKLNEKELLVERTLLVKSLDFKIATYTLDNGFTEYETPTEERLLKKFNNISSPTYFDYYAGYNDSFLKLYVRENETPMDALALYFETSYDRDDEDLAKYKKLLLNGGV